ncbi:hypothetical protein L915_13384 [Phytophthora nicotianae]|uniref:Uncharacterized protein n=2 Tax=Phytophthora nicotianae TaxID=4792 RepID=W2R884_PHYN3|nr:hypothetical protein PPTG_21361 [Phytophthora nicotianae INRA-310]ETK81066.1 hypothetical protein L915_13384 [Phytophthora nicotianae]ETN20735.1 hypothetical protein PPTG_21361 [Phytophthora nicotianae INRA-310]
MQILCAPGSRPPGLIPLPYMLSVNTDDLVVVVNMYVNMYDLDKSVNVKVNLDSRLEVILTE